MIRRAAVRLCFAGRVRSGPGAFDHDEENEREDTPFADPGGYGLSLESAYRMFGYRLGDDIQKPDVRKRFKKLSKKAHPDAGGSKEQFMRLMEAQKLLLTHHHGVHTANIKNNKKRPVKVTRVKHADIFSSVTSENAEEHRQHDGWDIVWGVVMAVVFWCLYLTYMNTTIIRSSDARSRMSEDDLAPQDESNLKKPVHAWHPWKTPEETKDELKVIEADRVARLEGTGSMTASKPARSPFITH